MKKFNALIALILMNTLLFGEALNFVSPQLSGSSGFLDSGQSTALAVKNPALTANTQRYTFDFSYFYLAGLTGNETGMGHVINLSGAVPSKYGVLSSAIDLFLNSGLNSSDLNLGTTGHINVNFSKELYSDLFFGLGLTTLLGTPYGESFDWGLGLNLGVIKDLGDVDDNIKDVRLGASLNNLGKTYGAQSNFFDPIVPGYTPSLFIDFSPYRNDKLAVKLSSELSFPTFSNVNLRMGAGLNFLENFNVESSIEFDLENSIKGNFDRLIPSFYFSYNLNPDKSKETKSKYDEAQFYISANPYYNGIWAFGGGGTLPIGDRDTNPPEVNIEYSETHYISPNFDGNNDELTFPITVEDERYIAGYEFEITDNFGKVVKKIVNKEERPENESIKNLYNKLITPKTGIPVPENFRWDGVKSSGEIAEDGIYHFRTVFYDDNGNTTYSKKNKFIIDKVDPAVDVVKPTGLDLIFSPNGDGNKDVLVIPQSGSKERLWTAEITDFMGNSIKSHSWDNETLSAFTWDGKDNLGQLVPDGVYKYIIRSTDEAGNSTEDFIDNIIINTKQPPIGITIDTNRFSPNGDNVKDFIEFVLDIPVKTGIVQWKLDVKDDKGDIINFFSTRDKGFSVIEDNIRYSGDKKGGGFLDEGQYIGELSVVYQNGHSPVVTSPSFIVDITPPDATVNKSYSMFSPNGDGSKDSIIFNQSSTKEDSWLGEIYDEFGTLVFTKKWIGEIDSSFIWDGKNSDGKLMEDGLFNYKLSSTDSSGNSYIGDDIAFEINTSKTDVVLNLSKVAFSPKDKKDQIDIKPVVDSKVDVVNYKLFITDNNGRTVRSLSEGKSLKELYAWDGNDNSGKVLTDNTYTGNIEVEFLNGNIVNSYTTGIILDTVKPKVDVKLKQDNGIFSPNGDGKKDFLTFIQNTSEEDTWYGEIKNSLGDIVNRYTWSGIAPNEFDYLGVDRDNSNLPDGVYTYTLYSTDIAGNTGKSKDIKLDIDTENIDLLISTNTKAFSPNGDNSLDTITFKPDIKKLDGIDSSLFEVIDNSNTVIYRNEVTSDFNSSFTWDGLASGRTVIDGEYKVKLTVNYKRGDSPIASTNFLVDTVAPEAEVLIDNNVFSPNGDGNRDVVNIVNRSTDSALWSLELVDFDNNKVKEQKINGELINWEIDGRAEDLTLLKDGEYIYKLTGVDSAGNKFESESKKITLDNSKSTLVLSNDLNVFSPNNDKVKDSIKFTPILESNSAVETWSLDIINNSDEVVRSYSGKKFPDSLVWNGLDNNADIVSDGKYRAKLNVLNRNGNNPISVTPELTVDTQYPQLEVAAKYTLFSPDGDNLQDDILLSQKGSGEELYSGKVSDNNGKVIKEWFWKGAISNLKWDGRDTSGNIVKDGIYNYSVYTTDLAGNTTSKEIQNIEIDTTETDIYITYKKPVFAPDLFKEKGGQVFGLIVNNKKGIESWKIDIKNKNNETIKTLNGSKDIPETLEWDGLDSEGIYANGEYKAEFNVLYKKGNSPKYSTKTFIADSQPPLVKVSTNPTPFSPDNDYVDDELTIELGVKDSSKIDSWNFEILDPKGNAFISFSGVGKPGNRIIWDGKSNKGELVQAAEEYEYVMTVVDEAGHKGVAKGEIPVDILVIKDGDKLKIQISSIIFEPNSTKLAFTGKNGESNRKILNRLSQILKKYSSYKIIVEGHANNIYGDEITKNQRNSLIDFSKDRAESVVESLTDLGISKGRLSTVGMGGDFPIVSVYDYDNTWKNRRVEFILVK